MNLFRKNYIYVEVCFLNENRPYSYRTRDRSIRVNEVVMVPAGKAIKPAVAVTVQTYEGADVLYPLNQTKEIICRADRTVEKLFTRTDLREILDISMKQVGTTSGHAVVVTSRSCRNTLRQYFFR